jgi:hypothetical protein
MSFLGELIDVEENNLFLYIKRIVIYYFKFIDFQ